MDAPDETMKGVIEVLNRLREDGVLRDYAIGGGMAALAYVEPFLTGDIDVFTTMTAGSGLVDPSPIFRRLAELGHREMRGDRVVIHGWPVQFLPPAGALESEAIAGACDVMVTGASARFFTAEHLIAIAVKLGRPKDVARVEQFLMAQQFEMATLMTILERHGLAGRWRELERRIHRGEDR